MAVSKDELIDACNKWFQDQFYDYAEACQTLIGIFRNADRQDVLKVVDDKINEHNRNGVPRAARRLRLAAEESLKPQGMG